MTVWLLMDAVKTRLEKELKDIRLKDENDTIAPLKFYLQNLPGFHKNDRTSIFPHIVIRLLELKDSDYDKATAEVLIIAGVYDENQNYQGYKDVMNILEGIRQALLREHILDERFVLDWPLEVMPSDDYSEERYPYYYGAILSNWRMPVMLQNLSEYE